MFVNININMHNSQEDKNHLSTPERKKQYIERWMEENPCSTRHIYDNLNTRMSPNAALETRKRSASYSPPVSTIINENLSSPVIGGSRRYTKRKKLKKLNLVDEKETKNLNSNLQNIIEAQKKLDLNELCNENLIHENNISELNEISEFNETSTIFNATKHCNDIEDCSKESTTLNEISSSQLIESLPSQNKNSQNNEASIDEIDSDTDKTVSDLIEEVNTQMSPSLNISNPSSSSLEVTENIYVSESNTVEISKCEESSKLSTSIDVINSISTLGSKENFNKISYILQYTADKQKKKRNPKKGSLLDTLLIAMKKEKSAVNILRHQLCKSTDNLEKPFILLQIMQYLPMVNGSQLLRCMLIKDHMRLLGNLLKSETRFINLINVPEISNFINVNEKPMLKIYEPITVLDPDQFLFHITRFIALPRNYSEDLNEIMCTNEYKNNLKIKNEFYCPCIDEKTLTSNCKSKTDDTLPVILQMVFNYNKC